MTIKVKFKLNTPTLKKVKCEKKNSTFTKGHNCNYINETRDRYTHTTCIYTNFVFKFHYSHNNDPLQIVKKHLRKTAI